MQCLLFPTLLLAITSVVSSSLANVSFLITTSSDIRQYTPPSDTFDPILSAPGRALTVDYHLAKNTVFALFDNKLYKTSLDPETRLSATVPTLVSELYTTLNPLCYGFAVDWVHDKIYWEDCSNNTLAINSMDLDGGNETVLFKRPCVRTDIIKRMEVDPYQEKIFWVVGGIIESCDLSGNNFRSDVIGADDIYVRALALDIGAQRVYFVGTTSTSSLALCSIDYNGGTLLEHFNAPQMRSVYGLGLVQGQVYWINYADEKDILYTAPLQVVVRDEGASERVKIIKEFDKTLWHMRVLHPDLQKQPSGDPCKKEGCA